MAYDEEQDEVGEKRKETDAQKRRRIREAFRSLLSREDGRLALSVVLGLSGIENENCMYGEASARIEGARAVGLRLVRILREADAQGYLNLYREMTNG